MKWDGLAFQMQPDDLSDLDALMDADAYEAQLPDED